MSVLQDVAEQVGVHERTLRRGLAEGLIRGRRPTPRSVELAPGEIGYLRASWPLLSALREALRKERSVRLAVLIGSAARGEMRDDSDVDLIVNTVSSDWRAREALRERLAIAAGRPVDLLTMARVEADPLIFHAAVCEGRPLVDRDDLWGKVVDAADSSPAARERAAGDLRARVHGLLADLSAGS